MRSVRDSDNNPRIWNRTKSNTEQDVRNGAVIHQIQRQLAGLKRRIVGGAASTPSAGMNFTGEYDPSATYNLNDVAVISLGINQGTFIVIVPTVTGIPPYNGAPNWAQLPGGVLGVWF